MIQKFQKTSKINTIRSKLSQPDDKTVNDDSKTKETQRYILLNDTNAFAKTDELSSNATKTNPDETTLKIIQNDYKIYDIISYPVNDSKQNDTITCNGVEMKREKVENINDTQEEVVEKRIDIESESDEYIYDIYYTKQNDIHLDLLYPNNFEIKSGSLYDQLQFLADYDANKDDDDEKMYRNGDVDDEDSNDEGNWRNDYPDEDDDGDDYDDDDDDDDDDDFDNYNHYNEGISRFNSIFFFE
jgi:hypothetical protein